MDKHEIKDALDWMNRVAAGYAAKEAALRKECVASGAWDCWRKLQCEFNVHGGNTITSLEDAVSLSRDSLEIVAEVEIGETREAVVGDNTIILGKKNRFTFLRIKDMPKHAFLVSSLPQKNYPGLCFSPALLIPAFKECSFLKDVVLDDVMPRFPLFSMPQCELCALGIKHSRRCDEDRQRVIEDAAQDNGITRVITAGFSHNEHWWDDNPTHSDQVLFLGARNALDPRRDCTAEFSCPRDHRLEALRHAAQHFGF